MGAESPPSAPAPCRPAGAAGAPSLSALLKRHPCQTAQAALSPPARQVEGKVLREAPLQWDMSFLSPLLPSPRQWDPGSGEGALLMCPLRGRCDRVLFIVLTNAALCHN